MSTAAQTVSVGRQPDVDPAWAETNRRRQIAAELETGRPVTTGPTTPPAKAPPRETPRESEMAVTEREAEAKIALRKQADRASLTAEYNKFLDRPEMTADAIADQWRLLEKLGHRAAKVLADFKELKSRRDTLGDAQRGEAQLRAEAEAAKKQKAVVDAKVAKSQQELRPLEAEQKRLGEVIESHANAEKRVTKAKNALAEFLAGGK